MALRLPLSAEDTTYDHEVAPSTAEILGFQVHDFYYRRSEDTDRNDEDFKRAEAAALILNDVAETHEQDR